ncbi:MAG: hypothetical protein EOO14_11640 [Chitinophagaceae bacterium]|nr:MAG: hypothetical protein EOO14_11640 [Chitinophagaceae bacterium]
MEHLAFVAYLIFFAWLVTQTRFFLSSGLTKAQLVILFLLKVMAGILYGWVGVYYGELAQMSDTWAYHYESLTEYKILLSDPGLFFSSLFHSSYEEGYGKFLAVENSWWNDLKGNFFIKILALFNLASFGNYYVNVIFYSFISLFGPVGLYRVMKAHFQGNRLAIILATFLVPSFLFWTSGLHKDGLIFLGLVMMIYPLYFNLKGTRLTLLSVAAMVIGFLLVLGLRNFMIIPLLPALLAWVLAIKLHWKPWKVFAGLYAIFIILFFTGKYIYPLLNFPEEVVVRQQAFQSLGGGSAVEVEKLQPNFASFLANLPDAITLSTIRPYPTDVRHLLSLAAAVEINFLLLVALLCVFYRKKEGQVKPFILFCIFFAFSVLLMIGYTVNILGAIVRYRSLVMSLLFIPLVAQADWNRIGHLLQGDMKEK